MSDKTERIQAYQDARAAFDARWQAAMKPQAPGEITITEPITPDALLVRVLARVRALALACAEHKLIGSEQRDAIHAAVDEIERGFAGVSRVDLAELMRSSGNPAPTEPPQKPPDY